MKTKGEMEMAFSILEKGVDGIVVPAEALQTAAEIASALGGRTCTPSRSPR
jgi:3-dehydroquinate synthase class II